MQGFQKISGKVIRPRKEVVKQSSVPKCSGQKGNRLYFNIPATEKFGLRNFKYVEIYLGDNALLVVPTNTKSDTTFSLNPSPHGSHIHARSLSIRAEIDLLTIKKHIVTKTAEGILVPLSPDAAPAVVKPRKFEVSGYMNVCFTTEYLGTREECRVKLLEHVWDMLGGAIEFEDTDVLLTSVTELPA